MAATNKPKVIKDYDKLPKEVKDLIKATYPQGFVEHLIQYPNKDGMLVSALPFETEDKIYLVRISTEEVKIVYDDFDDDVMKDDDIDVEKIDDIVGETNSDDDDFEEKYNDDVTIGAGNLDDGEDDDDEEEELPLDEDFDDDDEDFEEEPVAKPKSKSKK